MRIKKQQLNMNIFLFYIYNKPSKKNLIKWILYNRRVKRFKKDIIEGSPGFSILWQMADFIKYAEEIFFFDNSLKEDLYSSRSYVSGQNGFKVSTKEFSAVIKLFKENDTVALEVDRYIGNKLKSSFNFENNQFLENPSIFEEMLLEQVIKEINESIIKLFNYCYNAR